MVLLAKTVKFLSYSRLLNKRVGGKILGNIINVVVGINVLVGKFGKFNKHVGRKI